MTTQITIPEIVLKEGETLDISIGLRITAAQHGGGGGWSPADAAGLTFWYDAADASTLSLSGSRIIGLADKSPDERNLICDDVAGAPTYDAENGRMNFTRQRGLVNNGMPAISGDTLAVFAVLSYVQDVSWQRAVSLAPASGTDDQATDSYVPILRLGAATDLSSRGTASPVGAPFVSGEQMLVGSVKTPTQAYMHKNGVNLTPIANARVINSNRLGIGCVAGAQTTSPWTGTISEVVGVTDLSDIDLIVEYLTEKYA